MTTAASLRAWVVFLTLSQQCVHKKVCAAPLLFDCVCINGQLFALFVGAF